MILNGIVFFNACNQPLAVKADVIAGFIPKFRPHGNAVSAIRKGQHEIFLAPAAAAENIFLQNIL